MLYPAISLGSRENHKVEINLGLRRFQFNIDLFANNRYYSPIFHKILEVGRESKEDLVEIKKMKAQVAKTRGFHEIVKEFLINNGHTETLNSVFENPDIKPTLS